MGTFWGINVPGNEQTSAAEARLEGEAEALTRKAIELALAGDPTALRLCMERLVPPKKDRTLAFELPALDDVAQAFGAVLAAVAAGQITLSEAGAVAGLIEAQQRATGAGVAQQPTVQLNKSFVPPASRAESARACVSPRGEFLAIGSRD